MLHIVKTDQYWDLYFDTTILLALHTTDKYKEKWFRYEKKNYNTIYLHDNRLPDPTIPIPYIKFAQAFKMGLYCD